MICPNCKNIIDDNFSFCPECGNKIKDIQHSKKNEKLFDDGLEIQCNICGEIFNPEENFCPSCGSKITGEEKKKNKLTQPVGNQPQQNEKINLADSKISNQKNKSANVKKIDKKEITNSSEKKINSKQVLFLLSGVVFVGIIIIIFSGILDSPSVEKNNPAVQNNNQIDLATIQKINQLEESVKSDTTKLESVLQLAHTLNDSGFFIRAIEYYQMYLRANPKNVEVLIDLGVCYFELKNYKDAKANMNKGLKINPNHQIGLFNLGIVNFSQGYTDSAKYWWRKAFSINENTEIGKRAKQLLESN